MNNLTVAEKKPIQGKLTRLMNEFVITNPYRQPINNINNIYKNYLYVEQKRVIA